MNANTQASLFKANELIITHDKYLSFNDLIEPNLEIFSKFRLIYSTNNITSSFGYTSLDKIEKQCSSLKRFFHGSGLLFFSQDIYQLQHQQKTVYIPLDYSLSIDSNVAERFRIYEKGGQVQPQDKFESLIKFIKQYQFNFDYSFFCLENSNHIKQNNERPFNTLRAIIICNPLNDYPIDREEAGKLAISTMYNPYNFEIYSYFWQRRKIIYLILLKAIRVNWEHKGEVNIKLKIIIEFSFEKLGKFPKKEIYFAWKLFKYGKKLRFFDCISRPSNKTLEKAKGISWDLLLIEYQSSLAYNMSINDNFFVPFYASFDNRFVEFREACPIRCMLFDDSNRGAHTYFDDELEFNQDINNAIEADYNLLAKLTNQQEINRRKSGNLDSNKLDVQIASLEQKIKGLCPS